MGNYVLKTVLPSADSLDEQFILQTYSDDDTKVNQYTRKLPAWSLSSAPGFIMKDRPKPQRPVVMMSIPEASRLISPFAPLNDTKLTRLTIKLKDPSNTSQYQLLDQEFVAAGLTNGWVAYNFYDEKSTTQAEVKMILDIIFSAIILIVMFLAFFSLISSMTANLLDQTKEIGILRSMGYSKSRIKLLYFYEAFILVISSCLLGVLIGSTVGYAMVVQQSIFTSIPLDFYFPWTQFTMILVLSIICSFLSTWGPTTALLSREIADIFR